MANRRRREFCDKYEGYGDVCRCKLRSLVVFHICSFASCQFVCCLCCAYNQRRGVGGNCQRAVLSTGWVGQSVAFLAKTLCLLSITLFAKMGINGYAQTDNKELRGILRYVKQSTPLTPSYCAKLFLMNVVHPLTLARKIRTQVCLVAIDELTVIFSNFRRRSGIYRAKPSSVSRWKSLSTSNSGYGKSQA